MHKNSSKDKQNCRCLSIAAFLLLSARFVMMKSRELDISSFVKISSCFLELYLFTFSYLPIISYLIIHCFCFLFLEFTPTYFYQFIFTSYVVQYRISGERREPFFPLPVSAIRLQTR